jgi:hypothetical protein
MQTPASTYIQVSLLPAAQSAASWQMKFRSAQLCTSKPHAPCQQQTWLLPSKCHLCFIHTQPIPAQSGHTNKVHNRHEHGRCDLRCKGHWHGNGRLSCVHNPPLNDNAAEAKLTANATEVCMLCHLPCRINAAMFLGQVTGRSGWLCCIQPHKTFAHRWSRRLLSHQACMLVNAAQALQEATECIGPWCICCFMLGRLGLYIGAAVEAVLRNNVLRLTGVVQRRCCMQGVQVTCHGSAISQACKGTADAPGLAMANHIPIAAERVRCWVHCAVDTHGVCSKASSS